MKKAVLLCRVSSKDQEDTGYSLPAQEKNGIFYAQNNGLVLDTTFSFSETASKSKERTKFNELFDYLEQKNISILIVESTDRLTRNFTDVVRIDKWIMADDKHQVHLIKEGSILHRASSSHEWFMWRIKVADAEYYAKRLSENVKKGQKEKIAQGWFPSRPKLGYITTGDTGHKTFSIDTKTADIISFIFSLYSSGTTSIYTIEDILDRKHVVNRNGKKIGHTTINKILSDIFYIGKFSWNGIVYDGTHSPIISPELFYKVQRLLKRKHISQYKIHDFLFRGLINCGICQRFITWEQQRGHHYGRCHKCTHRGYLKQDKLENQLVDHLSQFKFKNPKLAQWFRKAIKEHLENQQTKETTSTQDLESNKKQYELRLSRLYDDHADGKIPESLYETKLAEYTQAIEKIESTGTEPKQKKQDKIKIFDESQKASDIYFTARPPQRKELIPYFYKTREVTNGILNVEVSDTFSVLYEAIKATNCSNLSKMDDFSKLKFEHSSKADKTSKYIYLEDTHPDLLAVPVWNPFVAITRVKRDK